MWGGVICVWMSGYRRELCSNIYIVRYTPQTQCVIDKPLDEDEEGEGEDEEEGARPRKK